MVIKWVCACATGNEAASASAATMLHNRAIDPLIASILLGRSLQPDIGRLCERDRHLSLPGDAGVEILGLHEHRFDAELGKPFLDGGALDGLHHLLMQPGDDVVRGMLGNER